MGWDDELKRRNRVLETRIKKLEEDKRLMGLRIARLHDEKLSLQSKLLFLQSRVVEMKDYLKNFLENT